jgi:microcystin-dependent protein
MGLETTVNFISDLNPLNPTDGDLAKDGDNHIRLIKAAVKQTFPNITGAVTATQSDLNTRLFPSGGIILWSGSIASIPSGWLLCDGTNGTPNLRDRFVVGAGSTYAVGATGGSDTVSLAEANLPAHSHTYSGTTGGQSNNHTHTGTTDIQGEHTHPIFRDLQSSSGVLPNSIAANQGISNFGPVNTQPSGAHAHNVSTSGASADHSHNFSGTTSSVGSGAAHENRPPYFALAYIMKA